MPIYFGFCHLQHPLDRLHSISVGKSKLDKIDTRSAGEGKYAPFTSKMRQNKINFSDQYKYSAYFMRFDAFCIFDVSLEYLLALLMS